MFVFFSNKWGKHIIQVSRCTRTWEIPVSLIRQGPSVLNILAANSKFHSDHLIMILRGQRLPFAKSYTFLEASLDLSGSCNQSPVGYFHLALSNFTLVMSIIQCYSIKMQNLCCSTILISQSVVIVKKKIKGKDEIILTSLT